MIGTKQNYLFIIISITLVITSAFIVCYKFFTPSVTENDIDVQATLEPNNTGINNEKEYLLNVTMNKGKNCNIALYPYIYGLGLMSFSEKDKDDYYVPGSIGSSGITEAIAIRELKKISAIDNDVSLIGFWFPDEAGKYSSQVYLDRLDSFEKIENPVLVCVYTENKSITQLTWSKVVPIASRGGS